MLKGIRGPETRRTFESPSLLNRHRPSRAADGYSNRRSSGVVHCGEVGRRLRRAGSDRSALGLGA